MEGGSWGTHETGGNKKTSIYDDPWYRGFQIGPRIGGNSHTSNLKGTGRCFAAFGHPSAVSAVVGWVQLSQVPRRIVLYRSVSHRIV